MKKLSGYLLLGSLSAGLFISATEFPATELQIVGKSHFVERNGQSIHIWEKSPDSWSLDGPGKGKVMVFLHGATYSGRPDFDLPIAEYSVMDAFVRQGWATYAVDVQGYGASDNPAEGSWGTAKEAALDLAAAVEWLTKERHVDRVTLFGWSWGCQVVGEFAQNHPEQVQAVVLQGATFEIKWAFEEFDARFRINTAEGAASDFIDGCFEPQVVKSYVEQCLLHDPDSPNGSLLDFKEGSLQVLKPKEWTWPTLVILGEHEATDERQADMGKFFVQLASKHKSFVILPGGGHAIFLEKPHLLWQKMVLDFLD